MKSIRGVAIVMLYVAAVPLGIAAIVFLAETDSPHIDKEHACRLMINGYVCLAVASVFFLTASILAFIAGAQKSANNGIPNK